MAIRVLARQCVEQRRVQRAADAAVSSARSESSPRPSCRTPSSCETGGSPRNDQPGALGDEQPVPSRLAELCEPRAPLVHRHGVNVERDRVWMM
jgi:hypothetical protein